MLEMMRLAAVGLRVESRVGLFVGGTVHVDGVVGDAVAAVCGEAVGRFVGASEARRQQRCAE
jgi:hypothetical protein